MKNLCQSSEMPSCQLPVAKCSCNKDIPILRISLPTWACLRAPTSLVPSPHIKVVKPNSFRVIITNSYNHNNISMAKSKLSKPLLLYVAKNVDGVLIYLLFRRNSSKNSSSWEHSPYDFFMLCL